MPQDYGSVHRTGTVCGASPDELRSLHRLWALADCRSFLDPPHILPDTDTTRDRGVFQLSDARPREPGGTPRLALDPAWDIEAAKRLWSKDRDFHDWPHCERATAAPSPTERP